MLDTPPRIPMDDFADEALMRENIAFVEKYAMFRVRGIFEFKAFRRVFGAANCQHRDSMQMCIDNLESTDCYHEVFERLLKSLPIDALLSERRALHFYLDIAQNPHHREAVRVSAIKEACVLAGITVIDEAGRTQKVPSLDELYSNVMPLLEAAARGDSRPPKLQ
jgi:hypothetical protein